MASAKPTVIPIIPLPRGVVLFPGVVFRIPVTNRPDITAILYSLTGRATKKATDVSIIIGCVPLTSPLISKDGQLVQLKDDKSLLSQSLQPEFNPAIASKDDLFSYGTAAKIVAIHGQESGEISLQVEGLNRITIDSITNDRPFLQASVKYHNDKVPLDDSELNASLQQLKDLSINLIMLFRVASLSVFGPRPVINYQLIFNRTLEILIKKKTIVEAGLLADFMTGLSDGNFEEKLRALATLDVKERVKIVLEILSKKIDVLKEGLGVTTVTSTTLPSKIPNDITQIRSLRGPPRQLFSPPSYPFMNIRRRDGTNNKELSDLDELQKKVNEAGLSPEAQKVANRELQKLRKLSPMNAEYGISRTYLEILCEIPWSKVSEDQLGVETLKRAREQLDNDHYGLAKIKRRLLEYLAVLKLKQATNAELDVQIAEVNKAITGINKEEKPSNAPDKHKDTVVEAKKEKLELLKSKRMVDKSPILLLVGPPGTGKTSLAKSVATSLGRKFHRISLGGVRDEAEIRGHRRTYVAAMPGLIVNGLRKVGVANPVFLLDEIDKIGMSNFQGDPSAAMLEVLDPEQNHAFVDHYVNVPIDLSKVLFIATANTLDTIPAALLDRMETISLSGYTTLEKRHIADRHLVPKQIISNGLASNLVKFGDKVIDQIINSYTRESGVRNLERQIGSVCRYKAVQYTDAKDSNTLSSYNPKVETSDLEEILGTERFEEELADTYLRPGIVTGLVAYSTGGQGSILFIEVADMPGNGQVQLTGKLGDVLKESVEVALTWVKAHSYELGLTADPNEDIMKNRNVHVHCPAGAIPKDGPSAGLAHTIALISLFSGKAVPPLLAMTGEVSLRGRILPVGGIKEKLIGALRAGVKTVMLPVGNKKDVKDLPQEVRNGLDIMHVKNVWDALRVVWPDARWPGEHLGGIESRL